MAKIKTLKDYDGQIVYPQTTAQAVSINPDITLEDFYNEAHREETDPTVPTYVKEITMDDITDWRTRSRLSPFSRTLTAADWVDNTQTVAAEDVVESSIVFTAPSPFSQEQYIKAGILCTGQAEGTLIFTCAKIPTEDIIINIIIDNSFLSTLSYDGTITPAEYYTAITTTEEILK